MTAIAAEDVRAADVEKRIERPPRKVRCFRVHVIPAGWQEQLIHLNRKPTGWVEEFDAVFGAVRIAKVDRLCAGYQSRRQAVRGVGEDSLNSAGLRIWHAGRPASSGRPTGTR